jgi:hypothetical protein
MGSGSAFKPEAPVAAANDGTVAFRQRKRRQFLLPRRKKPPSPEFKARIPLIAITHV